ncbi:hypothetical protein EQG49_11920 [Periweissella cryptocerci]|uniref:Uncharacterized protein n=1 Tax=Periweissella cryptocerci TaxID=2506420 RepID=A0A4P6YWE6_9LACO|nr:hypothetical protein [Periweissella cryptocerci]QBO37111.1 hypothetical protein EQG49_11920 [Periweissella cryptocerci]
MNKTTHTLLGTVAGIVVGGLGMKLAMNAKAKAMPEDVELDWNHYHQTTDGMVVKIKEVDGILLIPDTDWIKRQMAFLAVKLEEYDMGLEDDHPMGDMTPKVEPVTGVEVLHPSAKLQDLKAPIAEVVDTAE